MRHEADSPVCRGSCCTCKENETMLLPPHAASGPPEPAGSPPEGSLLESKLKWLLPDNGGPGRKEPRGTPGLSFTRASPDPEKMNCSCNQRVASSNPTTGHWLGCPEPKKNQKSSIKCDRVLLSYWCIRNVLNSEVRIHYQ